MNKSDWPTNLLGSVVVSLSQDQLFFADGLFVGIPSDSLCYPHSDSGNEGAASFYARPLAV